MTRTVRGSVSQIMRTAHLYLVARAEAMAGEANKKHPAADLKKYIAVNGEENADGHLDMLFPEPVTIAGTTYRGLRNQKSQGAPLLDEDAAEALVEKLGLRDRVAQEVTVTMWDWDELYVLNQQGLISDEQLDELFHYPEPSWSLVVIK